MEKSLKQIIYEVNVLVDAQIQLRSFHYGDLLDIIKKGSIDYASCFLSINSASNNASFETFNLELFVFDILAADDSNRKDIENTTKRILNDLITVIRYSTRWNSFSEVLNDVNELKYYDNLQDRLSGWGGTIQLKVYSNDCLVGLPIDDYDFDMSGNFEATVLAVVKNTDNDILATKLVSDSDDTIIIPNISFTDSDGTVTSEPSGVNLVCTPFTPCDDATVENSNASYTNTVVSGGTLVLPDITVTDSDGSTFTQPSVTNVTCTPGGGTGDVTVNGDPFGTYTAPDTFPINLLDGEGNPYLGIELDFPDIYIPPIAINVNTIQIAEVFQGSYSFSVLNENSDQVGGISGLNWLIADSAVSVNGTAYADVNAEDPLNVEVVNTEATVLSGSIVAAKYEMPDVELSFVVDGGAPVSETVPYQKNETINIVWL